MTFDDAGDRPASMSPGVRVAETRRRPFPSQRGQSSQGVLHLMRSLLRTLIASTAVAALLLGAGAASVLASSPTGASASVQRYDFDDAWCFDYGDTYDCTVVDATLMVTIAPDGRELARIHHRQVVKSFAADGTQIGSSRTASLDRTVFADGGQDSTFSVSHTRAVGDGWTCVSTYLVK